MDTDPNEDAEQVKEHAISNEFDWIFAVSPIEMTKSLIEEFGSSVVNAPSAPVIIICSSEDARLLKRGVKTVNELKQEIEKC